MDSNKKRYILAIFIMTIICAGFSIFLLSNLFRENSSINKKKTQPYIYSIESILNTDLEATEINGALAEVSNLGYDLMVIPQKYSAYYQPAFDFIIENNQVVVTRALGKEFYDYPLLEIGSVITEIDGQKLAELDYFDIFELLFSKELNVAKVFTLENGEVVNYLYQKITNRLETQQVDDKSIEIVLYDLDTSYARYVWQLCKDYENVIIDLSRATINDYNSIRQYLSLFAKEDTLLFKSPTNVKPIKSLKLSNNISIKSGGNRDAGIGFLLTAIDSYQLANVQISDEFVKVYTFDSNILYSFNMNYQIYLNNSLIELNRSNSSDGDYLGCK